MVNVVTAGRFKGKRIKNDGERVYIPIGREQLEITSEIVDHITIMSTMQNRSFINSCLRGFLARGLGNTAWLSAIQSAQGKSQFRIRIAYRDRSASVCVVDEAILDYLAVTFELI